MLSWNSVMLFILLAILLAGCLLGLRVWRSENLNKRQKGAVIFTGVMAISISALVLFDPGVPGYKDCEKTLSTQTDPKDLWRCYLKASDKEKPAALAKIMSLLVHGRNCVIEANTYFSQIEDPETVIPFTEDLVRLCCYTKAKDIRVSLSARGVALTAAYGSSGDKYTGAELDGIVSISKLPDNIKLSDERITSREAPSESAKRLSSHHPYEAPFPMLYKRSWLPRLFKAFEQVSGREALVSAMRDGMCDARGPKLNYYPVSHTQLDFAKAAKDYIGK